MRVELNKCVHGRGRHDCHEQIDIQIYHHVVREMGLILRRQALTLVCLSLFPRK